MHIYFSGIGGSGLNPLAHVALDCGFTVSGSDALESENITTIRERTPLVETLQDGSYIANIHESTPIDWFVYSSSLPEDHPELMFARASGIKVTKRQDLINFIVKKFKLRLIAIAGTHGKTTTTAMIVWAMKQLGEPVSYIIGSNISFGNSGSFSKDSRWLVIEADEYDRTMLGYKPFLSTLVSLDFDHPDTYKNEADYLSAFRTFIKQSKYCTMWTPTAAKLKLKKSRKLQVLNSKNNPIKSGLAGTHNRNNAFLAAAIIKRITKQETSDVIEALGSFPGTERRFEKITKNMYSDYAHHPEEIKATLQRASETTKNIIVAYQPHQNIRQHKLIGKYDESFKHAKHVYWLPTYLTREDPELPILGPEDIMPKQDKFEAIDLNDELFNKLKAHAKEGSTVIIMGAGSIDSWLRNNLFR